MFKHNRGYTLVEMLMATVLTLMMMSAVVRLFESVGRGVTGSRAMLETNDRLRMAALQLQRDLAGVTVTMLPPRRPENNEGYFEYMEGPIGPVFRPEAIARDSDTPRTATASDSILYENDTTVGDNDDILLFTTRSSGEPFKGRCGGNATIDSNVAEVAWFVRGHTLYRRVLLVAPTRLTSYDNNTPTNDQVLDHQDSSLSGTTSYYSVFDISARPVYLDSQGPDWVGNTLGDLTKRENRFAHLRFATYQNVSGNTISDTFPYNAGRWGQLGLPLLCECAASSWMEWQGLAAAPGVAYTCPMDYTLQPHPWTNVNAATGSLAAYTNSDFVGDDVVMTNVIGFDVKVWDPGAPIVMDGTGKAALVPGDPGYLAAVNNTRLSYGAYVDLNYMCQLGPEGGGATYPNPNYTPSAGAPTPWFYGAGNYRSGLRGVEPFSKTNISDPFDTSDLLDTGTPKTIKALLRGYSTYDTWSTHYEYDGVQQYGTSADTGTNGLDDSGRDANGTVTAADGIVDDPSEADTMPPYPVPLRSIQVTIRVYEPSTRKVIQRTIQQDFLAR